LIEAEATERIGAAPYERTESRVTERNGHRTRSLSTKAGDVDLRIPKLWKGSFFPVILEPRRRIDQALYAVVMGAYVHGVSTRSVDDLVESMGVDAGISKSEVSRICAGLDETVGAFRARELDHTEFPHVYLDATYLNVRNTTSQVVSMAVVVATGIAADGSREVLGLDVGDSEDETFWRGFLTTLKQRGLTGVRLVISDQHPGLVKALKRSFQGAAFMYSLDGLLADEGTEYWQFCFGLPVDPADLKQKIGVYQSAYAHIMGRAAYEGMAGALPTADHPFTGIMNAARKVVFSRTLRTAEWANTTIAAGDTTEEIDKLRRGGDGHIVVWGGVSFWRSLMQLDLIDEFRLDLHPHVAGEGTRLFDDVPKSYRLDLVSSTEFSNGTVGLHYRRHR
jgi:dihydrofolate reductase